MKITHHTAPAGKKGTADIYRLTNSSGAWVELSTLGAGILSIVVPDIDGRMDDVVTGYGDIADYLYDGPCMGKVPGRYANRIAKGNFCLDGKQYTLTVNNGPNALHGGPEGFQNQLWKAVTEGDDVVMTHISPDGDEGYPGELRAEVRYRWTEDNELHITFKATTDRPTVVNLTNHVYFNLRGEGNDGILSHELLVNARRYLPTDETLIPTGEMAAVTGTPMDFTAMRKVGLYSKSGFPAIVYGKGYDSCWVLDEAVSGSGLTMPAAVLFDPLTQRKLEVYTDQPAVQIYTGNWLSGCPQGKRGHVYHDYEGVAIECQGMPDAPNHPEFPDQTLRPGETYLRHIVFKFTVQRHLPMDSGDDR